MRRASSAMAMRRPSIADMPIKEEAVPTTDTAKGGLPAGFTLPAAIPTPGERRKSRISVVPKADAGPDKDAPQQQPQQQQQRRMRRASTGGIGAAAAVPPAQRSLARRRSVVQFASSASAALDLAEPLAPFVLPPTRPVTAKEGEPPPAIGARRASTAARASMAGAVAARASMAAGVPAAAAPGLARRASAAVFVSAEELRMREIEAAFPGMRMGAPVWFLSGPRAEEVFSRGVIAGVGEGQQLILELADGSKRERAAKDLLLANEGEPNSDVCGLLELNEATILKCLEERWRRQHPYTWIGSLLVSVNLFRSQPLPSLVSDEARRRYRVLDPTTAAPHVYAVAEGAVRAALAPPPDAWARQAAGAAAIERAIGRATGASGAAGSGATSEAAEGGVGKEATAEPHALRQAIVVSGESGAGKTVATQMIVEYIASRRPQADALAGAQPGALGGGAEAEADGGSSSSGGGRRSAGGSSLVDPSEAQQRLASVLRESATVLGAFGNAKTTRNLNASRYGRTVTLELNRRGGLCRGVIRTYLLERSRVTGIHDPERNFHIFYALMHAHEAGAIAPELPLVRLRLTKLRLTMPHSQLTYLSGSVHHDIKSDLRDRDDRDLLGDVLESLTAIGVSVERSISILRFAGTV